MNILWFKRDLRLEDHAALHAALQSKQPLIPLYILEPELWNQPDLSRRQYEFLVESLNELNQALSNIGQPLIVKMGDAIEIFNEIADAFSIESLWSHQETWNLWTFERDKRVKQWAKQRNITWHEERQTGVIRRLKNRDGWSYRWYQQMSRLPLPSPKGLVKIDLVSDTIPNANTLGLKEDNCSMRQKGGRQNALKCLDSFLHLRGEDYTRAMSSPVTAYDACSRLSPYLAFGVISMREVYQTMLKRKATLDNLKAADRGQWGSAMRSFASRLRWHCHFIQKLEDQPSIETHNLHSAYDGLREEAFDPILFEAWKTGNTGYPMIDACMRSLIATGWLNFRMRAMLMSFAANQLWLHWKEPALHLARLFVDYEPGIHFSQCQMQSGTTGINAIRIYSATKQAMDQDPQGLFIRRWIPELANMPDDFIHEPWECPMFLGDYPKPVVDEKTARKSAADKLYSVWKSNGFHEERKRILQKHSSRKPRKKS